MRIDLVAGAAVAALVVLPAAAAQPSFDCGLARQPAELAICGNARLSELDRILVSGYSYLKNTRGLAAADRIGRPYYFERLACGSDVVCIGKSQVNEIRDLADSGAPISLPSWLTESPSSAAASTTTSVMLESEGGTLVVPVKINDQITLKFVLDSGAADVSVPADVVLTLIRTGTLTADDFLGSQTFEMADGSTVPSQTFKLRSLQVGDRVLHDVVGSVAPVKGSLLLGQSFLQRFQSWSIDNSRQALVLR